MKIIQAALSNTRPKLDWKVFNDLSRVALATRSNRY